MTSGSTVAWLRIGRVCNRAHLRAARYWTMVHDHIPLVLSALATTAVSRPGEHEIRRLDGASGRRVRIDGVFTNANAE